MSTAVDRLRAALAESTRVTPATHLTDWFGRTGKADVVVRPATTDEVAATVATCRRLGAALVPVGGNTGLVGGTVFPEGDGDRRPIVILETTGLDRCDVDESTATAIVGAGVTVAAVQRAATAAGLVFGLDLASRDSATIGGAVATNAGGLHVCAYGTMRAQVLGLTAVFGDGSVVADLRGLPKDNTGFALSGLVIGSEGTLAVVTEVRLRLHRGPGELIAAARAVPSPAAAAALGDAVLSRGMRLNACEIVDARSWRAAAAELGLRDPLPGGPGDEFVAVVEVAAGPLPQEVALTGLAEAMGGDAVVATDRESRAALWLIRERQAEWWATRTPDPRRLHKYDVTLPRAGIDESLQRVAAVLAARPEVVDSGVFGHVHEGSLHLQAVCRSEAPDLDLEILRLVSAEQGSLSAEHGVGRDKAGLLGLRRSSAELALMHSIKAALDPDGIMNPGVILAPPEPFAGP